MTNERMAANESKTSTSTAMRVLKLIFLVSMLGCAAKKSPLDKSKTKAEVQKFMDDYAVMLKDQIENVGNLYYDSGAVMTFQGRSQFRVLDSLKSSYAKRPKTLKYFRWEGTRVDVLTEDAALVTAYFYWHSSRMADTAKFSYTGLLIKTPNGWKIKHEHESQTCPECK